jgi:hypothetical protein
MPVLAVALDGEFRTALPDSNLRGLAAGRLEAGLPDSYGTSVGQR